MMKLRYDYKELIHIRDASPIHMPDSCLKCRYWQRNLPTMMEGACEMGYRAVQYLHSKVPTP
jgi:hypothetical protein